MELLRFTKDHEYIRVSDEIGSIGISDYAQKQLGDVVFVELPKLGTRLKRSAQAAVVESVKAASEIFAPVSGEVVAVNANLENDPGRVNSDPLQTGWFFTIRIEEPAELEALMDEAAYAAFVASLQ